MAIVTCRECKAQVSSSAKTCPNCGIPKPHKSTSALAWIVAVIAVIVGVQMFNNAPNLTPPPPSALAPTPKPVTPPTPPPAAKPAVSSPPPAAAAAPATALPSAPAIPSPPPSVWKYQTQEDAMGGVMRFAIVSSTNLVAFDFPYNGAQKGILQVRSHPRHGRDVILAVQKGQFQCTSYSGCAVMVRFDDGKAARYSANSPADNDTTAVFLGSYDRFVGGLAKAKRVRIEATFYQQGNHTFDFPVEGFDASKLAAPSKAKK